MKTRAAVLWGMHQQWSIEEIDLERPGPGQVVVKIVAAGLCHSDDHFVTGDMVPPPDQRPVGIVDTYPMVGGHEGAGVVEEVGAGVTTVAPGDHVAFSFLPSCGRCFWCVTGRSSLCDNGFHMFRRADAGVPTTHRCGGRELNLMSKVGTFSERTVCDEASVIKIDPDHSLVAAALVTCGVATGWGSAVRRAGVQPGDDVVVIGVGGVGIHAVQGARMMSARTIVAVDPLDLKRSTALRLGATHAVQSTAEAFDLVRDLTRGVMAQRVIVAPGIIENPMVAEALGLTAKDGTCVLTGLTPNWIKEVRVDLAQLTNWQKSLRGSLFGGCTPRSDIPMLLDLYRTGLLKIDEVVTATYPLDGINDGYADMHAGKNVRGVLSMNE